MAFSEVTALFPDRRRGENAANELRRLGFQDVTVSSIEETNAKLMPDHPVENRKSIENSYWRAMIGLFMGGSLGIAMGSMFGAIWAMALGSLGGIVGAVIGLVMGNKNETAYEAYMTQGGVRIMVRSGGERQREEAVQFLKEAGADKVSIITPGGATIDGTIIPPPPGAPGGVQDTENAPTADRTVIEKAEEGKEVTR